MDGLLIYSKTQLVSQNHNTLEKTYWINASQNKIRYSSPVKELLHAINHFGHALVYPEIFGDIDPNSELSVAMEIASAGKIPEILKESKHPVTGLVTFIRKKYDTYDQERAINITNQLL